MTTKILLTIIGFSIISCSTYDREENVLYDKNISSTRSEIITLKSGAKVEKIKDLYLYQGDIVLSEEQLQGLDEHGDLFFFRKNMSYDGDFSPEFGINIENNKVGRNIASVPGTHWSMVRFTFDPNLIFTQKTAILAAIQKMESTTNVRFYNATGEPTKDPIYGFNYNYINFKEDLFNRSSVGSVGGKQNIYLLNFTEDIIIHEILHALGMFHEQSRPDRDKFINVLLNNLIDSSLSHNFDKVTKNYITIGSFDFNSIMLYNSYAFSKSSSHPTMLNKNGYPFDSNSYMSELDRVFVNTYYLPYKINPNGTRILLDKKVYKSNNTLMTDLEVTNLERKLNGEPPLWDGTGKHPMQP